MTVHEQVADKGWRWLLADLLICPECANTDITSSWQSLDNGTAFNVRCPECDRSEHLWVEVESQPWVEEALRAWLPMTPADHRYFVEILKTVAAHAILDPDGEVGGREIRVDIRRLARLFYRASPRDRRKKTAHGFNRAIPFWREV